MTPAHTHAAYSAGCRACECNARFCHLITAWALTQRAYDAVVLLYRDLNLEALTALDQAGAWPAWDTPAGQEAAAALTDADAEGRADTARGLGLALGPPDTGPPAGSFVRFAADPDHPGQAWEVGAVLSRPGLPSWDSVVVFGDPEGADFELSRADAAALGMTPADPPARSSAYRVTGHQFTAGPAGCTQCRWVAGAHDPDAPGVPPSPGTP
jgi:hypothetical protein